jgi:hypothetical protein
VKKTKRKPKRKPKEHTLWVDSKGWLVYRTDDGQIGMKAEGRDALLPINLWCELCDGFADATLKWFAKELERSVGYRNADHKRKAARR